MALICSSKLFVHFAKIAFYECLQFSFTVSNEVPEEPVLSSVSNHIFEKRLILKFVQQTGKDPINGEPLSEDQLIDIKGDQSIICASL